MWLTRASLLLVATGVLSGPGVAARAAQYYRGYAYTADDHRLLYTESHWLYEEQGVSRRLVIYACPDGQAFVRKWVDTGPGSAIPDVDMFDARTGYREGVRTHAGQREVYVQSDATASEKHALIAPPQNAVIDAGFDAFVREHWDALSGPGVQPLPFLILSQLHFVDFSARKLRDEGGDGQGVRWFRLQLAGWYAFVLPHIDVAYDAQTHELYQYRGLSNIRGAGNRNLNVTIEFPPAERRHDVAQTEVQGASGMPLTGHCASS